MIQKLLLFVRSLFYYFFSSSKERSLTPSLRLLCLGMFFIFVNSVSGQILERGTATTANTGGTTLTINKPTGIIAGDVMIVNIAQRGSSTLSNPTSTGWTLIAGADLAGTTDRWGAVLYKVATATDAAVGTVSYAFALDNQANGSVGSIVAFSGVDVSGGIFDVPNGVISVQGSQTAVVAQAKTTVTANTAVIMFGQAAASSPTWSGWSTATSPGALTELYENLNSGNSSVGAAWATKTTIGSTGAGSATLGGSGSERNGAILVALKPLTYKSQINSINVGSTTWCPGELRNVSVSITNVGTATWTDGGTGIPDINIGVKWNTSGANWTDYHSRVDAGNLAPGATKTYTLPIQATNNAGAGYIAGSDLSPGSNNLTFDVVYEGPFWFASNNNGAGPGNVVGTSPAITILTTPANKTIAASSTSICSGSSSTVTVALSELGVNYQLRNASNVAVGSPVAGTGGTISLPTGNLTSTTTFNVLATSCTNPVQMTGTATINVNNALTTIVGGPYTFCTDNGVTFTTANAAPGQYALVDVVSGFKYNFSVGDAFSGFSETLTILDAASDSSVTPAATNTGTNGTSITGWVASISGQIKVVLSTPNCAVSNSTTGTSGITVTQTATGNNLDSQTAAGTNNWIGHIYNAGGASPAPFTTANYAGYYTIGTETFDTDFGSGTACIPFYSNGTVRGSMYAEGFAVRYRMNSSRVAGCYIIKVTGDDGVRLSTDGGSTYLFDRWVEQGATTYDYIVVNLTTNPTFILDYYENATQNRVSFDIVPFNAAANTITDPTTINYCVSGDPAVINGSMQYNSGDDTAANPYINFQWQRQIDGGGFSNILGETGRTYNPPAVTNGTTSDIVYQFKRLATVNTTKVPGAACTFNPSNIVTITYSPTTVGGTASSNQSICSGTQPTNITLSGQRGTIQWQVSTDNSNFTNILGATSTPLTGAQMGVLTATRYYRAVVTSGACTSANSTTTTVTVTTIAAPTGTAGQSFCSGASPTIANLTATGTAISWYAAPSGGTALATTVALANNTHYYATQTIGGCESTSRFDVTATINTTPGVPTGTAGQSFCSGASPTVANLTATGTAISWYVAPSGGTALATTVALTNNTHYYATQTIGGCESTSRFDVIATVNATPGVPTGTAGQSFCSGTLPTVANLAATGTAVKWYSAPSGGAALATTVALANNTHYYATQTIGGCESTSRFDVTATINTTPGVPTGTAGQSFCSGASPTVANLTATGTAISWYAAPSGGTVLATTVALANNTHYYATQTIGGCESTSRFDITVTLIPSLSIVSISPIASQIMCPTGTGSLLTVAETGGGTITGHQWGKRSITGGTITPIASATNSTYTPTGTDLGVGTWLVVCTSTPTCGSVVVSNEVTVTVNPIPTITTANTPAVVTSVCASVIAQSTDLVYTSSTANGTSYSIDWATLTDQASTPYAFAVGGGSITGINVPAGTTAGTYNGAMTISNANCSSTINITLIVKPLLVAPVPGIPVQPTCGTQTGSVTLTGLPGSGTLLENDGTTIVSHAISSTSLTVVGLVPGTYRFAIDNGCTLTYSGNIVIQANTWNGASWSYGTDPSHNDLVDFRGNYNLVKNIDACSCTVSNGAVVTIASGKTLDVVNGVHVVSGSLTFEDSASLMQTSTSNSLNSGNITYIRNSADIRQSDYVYWSTPVKGQTLAGVSKNLTGDDYYFGYDGTQWVFTPKTTVMTVGKGYIIRGPDTFSNSARTPFSASFIGIPNNGNINGEAVVANNFYLIGNPYPSALDADAFILANTALLQGTLSFWTHNTPVDLSGAAYEYKSDDYATYNLSGGTSTRIGAGSGNSASGNNPDTPSGKIGAGQSFFAKVVGSGTITFNNLMRSGGNTNGQFFKPGKTSKTTALEKHRVWLDLTNVGGAFKQMLVGYIEGATNATEKMYDGVSMDGNKYIDFYSINEGENLVIQGRALPFADTDVVPLGYRTTVAGDFTISLDQADGVLSTQAVYLEDKTAGIIHDLRAGNYTYTTAVGTFENRFVLRYTNKTLGTGDFENIENGIVVSVKDKAIKVLSSKETIKEVTVFDVTGKLLYDKKKVGATELQITTLQAGNQVLLVEVTLENGYKTAKKIIFQ